MSRNKKPSSGDSQSAAPPVGAPDVSAAGGPGAESVTSSAPSGASGVAGDPSEGGDLPEMGRFGPKVAITGLDVAPPELEWQLPLNGELYKLLPGPDRPDYSVMVLERPLHFYPAESFDLGRLEDDQRTEDRRGRPMVRVHALLLCARFVGQQLHPGMSDLPVNLAYVIDNSLARDDLVDFAKIEYAAVGLVSEGHRDPAPPASDPDHDPGPPADGADSVEPVVSSGSTDSMDSADADAGDAETGAGGADVVEVTAVEPEPVTVAPAPDAAGADDGARSSVDPADEGIEPGELAEDGPPPMIVMSQVTQEAARTLRDGIAQQRGTHVENITATLTLDEQHRVTGLSGNADGQPPVPTPETFERLNAVLAELNRLPANHAVKGLTLRVEGNALNSDVDYRN